MKNNFLYHPLTNPVMVKEISMLNNSPENDIFLNISQQKWINNNEVAELPEILFITSYPPRECGIATYSSDLIKAIKEKYKPAFSIKICALQQKENIFIEKISYFTI